MSQQLAIINVHDVRVELRHCCYLFDFAGPYRRDWRLSYALSSSADVVCQPDLEGMRALLEIFKAAKSISMDAESRAFFGLPVSR